MSWTILYAFKIVIAPQTGWRLLMCQVILHWLMATVSRAARRFVNLFSVYFSFSGLFLGAPKPQFDFTNQFIFHEKPILGVCSTSFFRRSAYYLVRSHSSELYLMGWISYW